MVLVPLIFESPPRKGNDDLLDELSQTPTKQVNFISDIRIYNNSQE